MFTNLIVGLLGVLFVTIVQMISLKKDAEKLNQEFIYSKYFKKDGLSIILSILSVLIWFFLFPEASLSYPGIANLIRTTFFCAGAIGAYVLQLFLGGTKQWTRKIMDVKSNISDGVTPA